MNEISCNCSCVKNNNIIETPSNQVSNKVMNEMRKYGYNSIPNNSIPNNSNTSILRQTTQSSINCLQSAVLGKKDDNQNCLSICENARLNICKGTEGEAIPASYCPEVCEQNTLTSTSIFNCLSNQVSGNRDTVDSCLEKCKESVNNCKDSNNNSATIDDCNNVCKSVNSDNVFSICSNGATAGQCRLSSFNECIVSNCNNDTQCISDASNKIYNFCMGVNEKGYTDDEETKKPDDEETKKPDDEKILINPFITKKNAIIMIGIIIVFILFYLIYKKINKT